MAAKVINVISNHSKCLNMQTPVPNAMCVATWYASGAIASDLESPIGYVTRTNANPS